MAKGNKNRAEQVLSGFIREMANEPMEDGQKTRAEALAEIVWRLALGWTETLPDGTIKMWPPAKWAIDLVYERAEGKAAQVGGDDGGKARDPAEKISQQMRDRINKLAEVSSAGSTKPKPVTKPAPPERKIPHHPGRMDVPHNGAQGPQTGCKSASELA